MQVAVFATQAAAERSGRPTKQIATAVKVRNFVCSPRVPYTRLVSASK